MQLKNWTKKLFILNRSDISPFVFFTHAERALKNVLRMLSIAQKCLCMGNMSKKEHFGKINTYTVILTTIVIISL